ncbi:MAG: NADH:flavin oxidoreductase [Myxococcales bacterium]|nr:NADH:flavin oxidoreductase [Myxococcales bacterium]
MPAPLTPFTFRNGVTIPNRVALAPLTNLQSHADGTLSDVELRWLARRAAGGFGLISTCAAYVAVDGKGWPGELGVERDDQVLRLAELATALAVGGGLSIVQLFHGGTRAPSAQTGAQPWSASAYHEDGADFEPPAAATTEDLERTIAAFADAAARCARAGFGGVELHGAHGYLLSQFLSTAMNLRTDGWGGDLVGRARLIRTVLRAVRARVAPGFVVGVRLSPEDFGQARGLDLDETVQVARWLCEDGADFIHLSLWRSERMTTKRPDQHPIDLFRAACPPEVAIIAAGAIWTVAEAQAALDRGADLVALGRAAIVNPDWPREAATPGWAPRRPPLTIAELEERAVSPHFGGYLRRWKGFVAD